MQVGVVAEGWADIAVIRCVLKGALGVDGSDVLPIRPELQSDETDRNAPDARTFSNWQIVLEECREWSEIERFLSIELGRIVVVQIDTAECELAGFDVVRPDRSIAGYVDELCDRVEAKLREVSGDRDRSSVVFAVAVEEVDAWLLAHYLPSKNANDTGLLPNPKQRLDRAIEASGEFSERERQQIARDRDEGRKYARWAKPLAKRKALDAAAARNRSLARFVTALEAAPNPVSAG